MATHVHHAVPALLIAGAGAFALGMLAGGYWTWFRLKAGGREGGAGGEGEGGKGSGRGRKGSKGRDLSALEKLAEKHEEFKMVLVVRNDLKMGKGKIGAQCGHATLGLFKQIHNRAPMSIERWEDCGQVKVVVRVDSEEEMLILQDKARAEGIPTHTTIDAGRTQIAPNSRTVMALLGPEEVVSRVTGHLKLL